MGAKPMSSFLNTRETSIRKAAFFLLTLVVLGSGFVTLLHQLDPDPQLLSLVLPPLNLIINSVLLFYLYRNPEKTILVCWIAAILILINLVITTWFFTLQATFSEDIRLVESFPPISSLPLVVIVTMFIFARPNQVLIAALVTWSFIALPILIYLGLVPSELFTPRGLEMTLTLGPVMGTISALIPLHRGIEQTVSSLKREREQMQNLSERDPLTQLYNRRGLEAIFSELLTTRDLSLGVILFDIDHFKNVNDQYGHHAGDTVLCQVAQRCKSILRHDDYLARWGGEEFLVLIQGIGDKALYRIAEDLRMVISDKPIQPVGTVTASLGVTQFCPTDSIESLLQRVDEAMYSAKQQGRNRVVVRP